MSPGMIKIAVTVDPDKPRDCRPADLLQGLLAATGLANCRQCSIVEMALSLRSRNGSGGEDGR